MAVSADDPRSPYQQVADDLRAQITRGDLAPGHRLPSGRDLATRYGVALMTVQKALAALREDGLVTAQTGRGTFVSSGTDGEPATDLVSVSRQLDELRALVESTAERFETRLAAVEKALAEPGKKRHPRA